MGGKKRHSQDRMYITSTEWKNEYGGKKNHSNNKDYRPLPFDHCALSLSQFQTPVCTQEGVVFDFVNLAEHIRKHGKNPITGAPMTAKDIIRLNMAKNAEGAWHCPVTFKTFNNHSSIAAIKTTGNVFSLEAVKELNITPKNFTDLLTGEPFTRSDIIILQDPSNPEVSARRDINGFEHLKELRSAAVAAKATEGTVRHNPTTSTIMQEMNKRQKLELENPTAKSNPALLSSKTASTEITTDVDAILALSPTIDEVCPGRVVSDQRAGGSFTSTSQEVVTSSTVKKATVADIREARWKKMREVGKKGYVQLQTNIGNLNLEIHCDCAQRTSFNFMTLCERGYYDETIFHRLVPGFIIQGGDPTGTGSGGESAFGGSFRDEFDSRLIHDSRGVLSMANSGANTSTSQFFITFAASPHLDLKHCVFGRVVGGNATLDRMEAIEADKNSVPLSEIKIMSVHIMVNPIAEADALLVEQIERTRESNKASELKTLMGKTDPAQITGSATAGMPREKPAASSALRQQLAGPSVGKYLGASASSAPAPAAAVAAASAAIPRPAGSSAGSSQSQADKIAAFLRSQGGSDGPLTGSAAKKRKMGGDFSAW